MILIENKRHPLTSNAPRVYVGRPSALGNPFGLSNKDDDASRGRVCEDYRKWLSDAAEADPRVRVRDMLARIATLEREHGTVILQCWCAPKRCHAEEIRAWFYEQYTSSNR